MARRRLTPLPADLPTNLATGLATPGPSGTPPIARVAGAEATAAALREVADELAGARAEGRLALRLPLDQIEDGWLVRDRLIPEGEEFAALLASLRAHGQRTAIEVSELAPGRYGLISGWRRLTALRQLHSDTAEDRFATVLAVLRRPEGAAEAYLAMVEENEIRAGLSYYERARIVARAAEAGVFPGDRAALQALFGAASRARRSKIGSFVGIYRTLDGVLRHPAAIPERLGLRLAQALEGDATVQRRLRASLARTPPATPEAEIAVLQEVLAEAAPREGPPDTGLGDAPPPSPAAPPRARAELRAGVRLSGRPGRVTLSGTGVDAAFIARLRDWLGDDSP